MATIRWWPAAAATALCLASGAAWADDDKARDDVFSGSETDDDAAEPAKPVTKPGAPTKTASDDEPSAADLGDSRLTKDAKENTELLTRDRTQIGGFFYNRNSLSLGSGQKVSDTAIGNTNLFEAYFDSRINDRLRVYTRGRVIYNPLADVPSTAPAIPGLSLSQSPDEVRALLTQMWIKFDIARSVFVTAGRQFVRFGATRFWNPVDVINNAKFNPLLFFDDRVGPMMLKIHVPVESKNWNFYAILLNDNAAKLDQLGGVLRAEFLVGPAEIGLVGALRKGADPKIGLDLSSAIWELDFTGELAAWFPEKRDSDGHFNGTHETAYQAAAGLSYTWPYREDDTLVIGVEYFHNGQGVGAQAALDAQIAAAKVGKSSPYLPLYTGKHYAGLVATVVSPGDWRDASVSLIGLGNLTDQSFTGQINFSNRVITDLTVEVFGSVSQGSGEFRGYVPMLKDQLPTIIPGGIGQSVADSLHAPLFRAGLNLRCDL